MKFFKSLSKIFSFLLQCSKSIRFSSLAVVVVLLTGIIAGLGNAALVAIINSKLSVGMAWERTLFWSFAALCLLLPTARFVSGFLLTYISTLAVANLRLRLCRQILDTPLRRLEELGTHRLLGVLTDDIPAITNALGSLPILFMHISMVAGCLVYMGWLSWKLLLLVTVFISLGIVVYELAVVRAMNYFRLFRERWDELLKNFRALTEGNKELKLHRRRREAFFIQHLEAIERSMERYGIIGQTFYIAASSWGRILIFILIGLILFAAPTQDNANSHTLSAYVLAILFMTTPLEVILNTLPGLGRTAIAIRKVEELGLTLVNHSIERSSVSEANIETSWSRLEMIGVTHSYQREGEDRRFILGPLDIILHPGELIFLIGGNGSGKTTLAKILTGLYAPETGEIRLDGRPVTDLTRDDYRQRFSAVFSDYFLFERLLGLDSPDLDGKSSDYLTRLELDNNVQVRQGVLSTIDLSQGQRKRLALLTAYLEGRSIYVFDEWAADQDALFREIFYSQILPELRAGRKTVIVISHDDRYYHLADRVIKLDYGKLVYDKIVVENQTLDSSSNYHAEFEWVGSES